MAQDIELQNNIANVHLFKIVEFGDLLSTLTIESAINGTKVNGVITVNSATGVSPSVGATGNDTHITTEVKGKGTNGGVRLTPFSLDKRTQTAKVGTVTLTAAEVLTKVIDGTPVAAATYTLPTAALLVTAIAGAKVGDSLDFVVNNKTAGAFDITVAAGSGGTGDGNLIVYPDAIRRFTIVITNVTGSSEAYYVYGEGAVLPATERVTQTALADTATVTASQLLTKVLDGTPTAAAVYTLPTAALLVAAMPGVRVGDSFKFLVNNKSAGANTITVAAGSGGTGDGTLTVAQDVIREFSVIVTNITGSSEAYFVYGIV